MGEEIIEAKFSQEVDLEKLLSEVGEGWRLIVRRVEPEWCDGHLGTIQLDPNEPLSMDSLRRKFGGRKLQFKIQKANGDYVAHRTVKFPDPPRHNGSIMVEGQGWGDNPQHGQAALQAQPANGQGQMDALVKMMMEGQRETSKMMIDSLTSRVNHLEAVLQSTTDRALGIPPVQVEGTSNNFDGIKDSIKTIQEIEKFKEAIGVGEKQDPSIIESGLEKIMDLMLKKEEMKMQAVMNQQSQATQVPALGPQSTYVEPRPGSSNPDDMSDLELAAFVKKRLEGMPEEERLNIISKVAGIELIEEEDDNLNDGQEDPENVDLEEGLPGVELTEQDEQRLDAGNNATQGAPKHA